MIDRPDAPASAERRSQRETPKIQRWVDLLATLLVHTYAVPFDQLADGVPAYGDAAKSREARERMFERDKEELRTFGVPLETVELEPGVHGYRLRRAGFYLPYLALTDAAEPPERLEHWQYRGVPSLAFEPEELAAVVEAARRVQALGDPALAREAAAGLRKLAFDLPVDAEQAAATVVVRDGVDPDVLAALGEALAARKRVTFDYRHLGRDATEARTVEPWGLFFLGGHWYLAACDPARGAGLGGLRNFRVSRIAGVTWDARRRRKPDYAVPPEFRLREHARSRRAWELGDGDAEVVTVRFHGSTGAVRAACTLGEEVPDAEVNAASASSAPADEACVRRFRVRRRDAFVRWLLTFGPDARPLAPPDLADAWRAEVARTRARYGPPGAPPVEPQPFPSQPSGAPA